jgi:hypothetical protein
MGKISLFNSGSIEGHKIWYNFEAFNKGTVGWTIIASGYQEAFEVVSRELIRRKVNRIEPAFNSLIFPIVYLFRHFCEMTLKEFIIKANELLDFPKIIDLA